MVMKRRYKPYTTYLQHYRQEKRKLEAERLFLLNEHKRLTLLCETLTVRLQAARNFVRICEALCLCNAPKLAYSTDHTE